MQKRIRKNIIRLMISVLVLCVCWSGLVFASGSDMKGHDMNQSNKIGDLIHESAVNGYMLSYTFFDPGSQKNSKKDMANMEMDQPQHLMVYIMDKNHAPVLKARVGFLIKNDKTGSQKAMAMLMNKGFGITVDMKEKGIYKITCKFIAGGKKIMDRFIYEIK